MYSPALSTPIYASFVNVQSCNFRQLDECKIVHKTISDSQKRIYLVINSFLYNNFAFIVQFST